MRRTGTILMGTALLMLAAGCQRDLDGLSDATTPFPLQVPPGHPFPPLNEEAPLTLESVRLGKALFFEPRLSRGAEVSCGSCHADARMDRLSWDLGNPDDILGIASAKKLFNQSLRGEPIDLAEQTFVGEIQRVRTQHGLERRRLDMQGPGEVEMLARAAERDRR